MDKLARSARQYDDRSDGKYSGVGNAMRLYAVVMYCFHHDYVLTIIQHLIGSLEELKRDVLGYYHLPPLSLDQLLSYGPGGPLAYGSKGGGGPAVVTGAIFGPVVGFGCAAVLSIRRGGKLVGPA
jgi:hypothetical protein